MMNLIEYQERLNKLSVDRPLSLKFETHADALPGWLPALEQVAKGIRRAIRRIESAEQAMTLMYWVDRRAREKGRAKLAYRLYTEASVDDEGGELKLAIEKTLKGFSRRAERICAICGAVAQKAGTNSVPGPRCRLHQIVDDGYLNDDTWDELFGMRMSETADVVHMLQKTLARWTPLLGAWPHKTRAGWAESYAGSADGPSAPTSTPAHDDVRMIGGMALRALLKQMGGNVSTKHVSTWINTVVTRQNEAFTSGVDTLPMLGAVITISLQEHGSPLLIITCLDGFLNLNGYELGVSATEIDVALSRLAEGRCTATVFADWIAQHMRRISDVQTERILDLSEPMEGGCVHGHNV